MNVLSFQNPVFAAYALAAALMILKVASMSWLTVVRMTRAKGGFRNPEDLQKTPFNPDPDPKQLDPYPEVERIRRIQGNDLESVPLFLVAGFLFVLTDPSLPLARGLFFGYVATRLLHFAAYLGARTHETRALFWAPGSLIIVYLAGRTAYFALCH